MKLRELRIVFVGLLGGTVLYTLVAFFLVQFGTADFTWDTPPIPMEYAGAAILLFMAGGTVVRRQLIAQLPRDGSPDARMQAYGTAVIVGLAVQEGAGIMLITLGIVSGSPTWILAGGLASAVMIWQGRPNPDEVGLE